MHFLCLHGMGTNSRVFEMQTAALRYELGDHHTYEFVEGTIPSPIAPEIKAFAGDDKFYSYFDPESVESCRKALDDLDAYIAAEGPFDAILAFSQGAALAATLIVRKFSQESKQQHVNPTFKCAVFLSGGVPCDPSALLRDELRILDHASDGEVIPVPTANIWGSNDLSWPPELSKLCMAQGRTVFIHDGGHEVPGSKSKPALTGTVQAIRRTVDKALYTH